MNTIQHDLKRRPLLQLPLALLLAGIAFTAMSAAAAGDDEPDADNGKIDIMAFDLP